jgi:chemotaxis signal transduction protein
VGNLVPSAVTPVEHETLVFRLGDCSFGLDLARVHGIVKMREITPCAREGSAVCGLVSVKGRRIPVYDLSGVLHSPRHRPTPKSRIIVAEAANGAAAFVVDSVARVVSHASGSALVETGQDQVKDLDLDSALKQTELY